MTREARAKRKAAPSGPVGRLRQHLSSWSSGAPARVWLYIFALALVGRLAWALAIIQFAWTSDPQPLPWLGVAATMVGASLLNVTFMLRGDTFTLGLAEIPLVVGVVFLRPQGLLLAAVVAQVVVSVVKRRPPS